MKVSYHQGGHEIKIEKYESIAAAPHYHNIGGYEAVRLTDVAVVEGGMQSGNPTVDLVFIDSKGEKHVALVTGALIKAISSVVGDLKG